MTKINVSCKICFLFFFFFPLCERADARGADLTGSVSLACHEQRRLRCPWCTTLPDVRLEPASREQEEKMAAKGEDALLIPHQPSIAAPAKSAQKQAGEGLLEGLQASKNSSLGLWRAYTQ